MKNFLRLGHNSKCFTALLILILALSFSLSTAGEDKGHLICPGSCIGKICLDDSEPVVRKRLGKPKLYKSLHGKYEVDIWKSQGNKPEYLFVVYQGGKVTDIHVTSSSFKTKGGISTESNFDVVKKEFPQGHENEYALFDSGHNRLDWDVENQGITFTFADDKTGPLIRIAVHKPNTSKVIGYSEGEDWYWYP